MTEWSLTVEEGTIVLLLSVETTPDGYTIELWSHSSTGVPVRLWSAVLDDYGAEHTDVTAESKPYWLVIRSELGEVAWQTAPAETT